MKEVSQVSRPVSPFLELKPKINGRRNSLDNYQVIQKREKIHRIRTRSSFLAEVTYVTSPSEIWVRPTNNIAHKLTIPLNFSTEMPNLETNLKEKVYVMTPEEDDILVRARIILYDDDKQKYLLRLIDHGKPVWRNAEDIFEMKSEGDEMRKYPWQAISLILQGVKPRNGKEWVEAEICAIREALTEFPVYFVIPTPLEHMVINSDAYYIRASFHGMDEDDLEMFRKCKSQDRADFAAFGLSAAEYYKLFLSVTFDNEPVIDFIKQDSFPYPDQYGDFNEIEGQNSSKKNNLIKSSVSQSSNDESFVEVSISNSSPTQLADDEISFDIDSENRDSKVTGIWDGHGPDENDF